jgi:WD40 repeat protein
MVFGGSDGHLYYREWVRGQIREVGLGTTPGIASLTFSRDGKTLACSFLDRSAKLYSFPPIPPRSDAVARNLSGYGLDSVALTPNKAELATAGGEKGKEVVFWSTFDFRGRVVQTIRDFPDPLTAVALSPDGKQLAAGSIAGTVHVVNVATPSERRSLNGHSAEVRCVAFSPDGKTLASGGVDGVVRLWDPATGKPVRIMHWHRHVVLCLAFSPDNKFLASGGADGAVRVWDLASGAIRATMAPRRPGEMVFSLAFAPDGKLLAAACGEDVRRWDVPQ